MVPPAKQTLEKEDPPAIAKTAAENGRRGLAREWTVQVAALADKREAVGIVRGVRKGGYDAYVLTTRAENRTLHRVRVGQFTDMDIAMRARQSLLRKERFQSAYVAFN